MARKHSIGLILLGASVFLTGCQQQMSMEDMMKPTPRPAELDRLDDMVGKWQTSGECKVGDQTMKSTGTSTATWECDRRVVVEKMEGTMGDRKHSAIGIWTWDADAKVYRSWWFDSDGHAEQSTATYDADAKVWTMKSDTGSGYFKNLGNDQWEWAMSMTSGGMFPKTIMEMKGTGRKTR